MISDILKMIESVAGPDMTVPEVVARLDEIDIKVWDYIFPNDPHPETWFTLWATGGAPRKLPPKEFTRSRDALKSIRPERCNISQYRVRIHIEKLDDEGRSREVKIFHISMMKKWKEFDGKAETEELAELHAILQAIEYERNNANT